MDTLIFKIVLFLCLFLIGWLVGRGIERKHLLALDEEEQRLGHIRTDISRFKQSAEPGQLISSNVVISHDYFKFVIATIQNFFGGRLTTYETVIDRARREAVVRLKREAEKIGATEIQGLRLCTSELGMQGGMVEVFAYGTAIQTGTAQQPVI